jgi:hypothetical protein
LKQVGQELKERGESGPAKRVAAALDVAQAMVKPQEGLVIP